MTKRCIIDECDNPISPNSRLDACPTCRAGLNYWNRKRPAQILDRRRKLTMYHSRLGQLVDDDVIELPTKRKRAEFKDKQVVRITTKLVRAHQPASRRAS